MEAKEKLPLTQAKINKLISLLDLSLAKEIIEEMFDVYLNEKQAQDYVNDVLDVEFERVSDCCNAPLVAGIESEMCSECGEHCGIDYI